MRYTQPQSGARIDWGNPLTRGLVGGFMHPEKTIKGAANTGSLRGSPTNVGMALVNSTDIGVATFTENLSPRSDAATFVVLARRDGLQPDSGFGIVIQMAQVSGVQDPFQLFIKDSGERIRINTDSADSTDHAETIEDWVVGKWMVGCYTWTSGSQPNFWRDGRAISRSTSYSSAQIGTIKTSAHTNVNHPTLRLNGAVAGFLVFNRALSPAEIKSISDNPWQIFADNKKPIFIGVGAAGGGLSITAELATASASGHAATVNLQSAIHATLATATASGFTANVGTGNAITATLATATASGQIAAVNLQLAIVAQQAIATAYGFATNLGNGVSIAASYGLASADGYQAQVNLSRDLAATQAIATASGSLTTIRFGGAGTYPTAEEIVATLLANPQFLTLTKFLALKDI